MKFYKVGVDRTSTHDNIQTTLLNLRLRIKFSNELPNIFQ